MKKRFKSAVLVSIFFFGATFLVLQYSNKHEVSLEDPVIQIDDFEAGESYEDKLTTQKDRAAYFHRLLRDPSIDRIPSNSRAKEIEFVRNMEGSPIKLKSANEAFDWKEIGPDDVGGRTRGLGMDQRNSDILIAGGVSGGIWKSIDGGLTWNKKTDLDSHLGVTDLIQDPFNPDEWYYITGAELVGSSPSGVDATYFGRGIFFSDDNGETWSKILNTGDLDNAFSSRYDFMINIEISPVTGSIFFSTSAYSIYRSTDKLQTSFRVVGGSTGEHIWSDVAVNNNGVVIAVLSGAFDGFEQTFDPGVYISTNDGLNWTDITPSSFPNNAQRSVIGTSDSNPNIFYILTDTGGGGAGMKLHRFDITNPANVQTSERSEGIPNFGEPVGDLDPQIGYNMICKVHPTNPNIVFLGGINLYRSTDGYSSIPPKDGSFTDLAEAPTYWIGGYDFSNDISLYPQHHPDLHNLIFFPESPNRAISAHDGGLSITEDITATPVVWQDLDAGYNVTQFYKISIHPQEADGRIMGGTQDNGSPYFLFDFDAPSSNSVDASSGDGAVSYIGDNFLVSSSQNGALLKFDYSGNDLTNFSYITPLGANNQQFIHPYAVNPSDENYMFYVEEDHLWRNNQLTTLPRNTGNPDGTSIGWTELPNVSTGLSSHEISALSFSVTNPSNRLYFAGSSNSDSPIVKRLDNLDASDGEATISITGTDPGSYVNDIAVNADDGNEVMVVMSNYEVKSIWHSSNAGSTWADVEGNLAGSTGPSIRSAAIAETDQSGTFYFVGTSVGLFYTDQLDGSSTIWTRVAEDVIGNVIVSDLDYRRSDQTLAVGTHGRGIFIGRIGMGVSRELEPISEEPSRFALAQNFPNPFNPSTNIEFSVPTDSRVSLTVFDINGREVSRLYNQQSFSAGTYSAAFDASSLASGTYIYRIEAVPLSGGNVFQQTKTMTLIK